MLRMYKPSLLGTAEIVPTSWSPLRGYPDRSIAPALLDLIGRWCRRGEGSWRVLRFKLDKGLIQHPRDDRGLINDRAANKRCLTEDWLVILVTC